MAQTNFTAADMLGVQADKPVVVVTPVVTPEPAKKVAPSPAKSSKKVEAEVETVAVVEESPVAETE